jgi:Spy/CpxP family protein refolding chaperone
MKRIATILAATALSAGMALAETQTTPAPANQPGRHAMAHRRLAQALNLTPAQKAQAREIFGQARKAAQPLRAELKQDRQVLSAAVKANDTSQIEKLSAAEGRLIGKLMAAGTEAKASFYRMLTPEQQAKVDQMQKGRMPRRHERG